jgi:hypothetical protein
LAALHLPGKGSPVPIGQGAGWTPELVWTQRLEEKSSCLCQGSNLNRLVVSAKPDAVLTELPQLFSAVLTAVKMTVLFWVVILFGLVSRDQCFTKMYCAGLLSVSLECRGEEYGGFLAYP